MADSTASPNSTLMFARIKAPLGEECHQEDRAIESGGFEDARRMDRRKARPDKYIRAREKTGALT